MIEHDLFELYKEQKNEFIKALKSYDPTIRFKYYKDPKDLAAFRKNPFFMFYPSCWEISPGQLSGVHFSFHVRAENARLCVGVESPIRDEHKEKFKRAVAEELKKLGADLRGFDIWPNAGQSKRKVKLLEVRFPFDSEAWRRAIDYYKQLEQFIVVVSEKIDEYKRKSKPGCHPQKSWPDHFSKVQSA